MDEKNAVFLAAGGKCVVFLQRALSEIQSLTAKDAEDAKETGQAGMGGFIAQLAKSTA